MELDETNHAYLALLKIQNIHNKHHSSKHSFIVYPLADNMERDRESEMDHHPQSSSSVEYTSLKDILPWQKTSYIYERGESWRQIPIKDPLLQHAAWAYLLPTRSSEIHNNTNRNLMKRLMDKCVCCLFDCFGGFFRDKVWSKASNACVKHEVDHESIQEDFDDEIWTLNEL